MKIVVYNGYPLSVFVAIVMHILLLGALLYIQSDSNADITDITQPSIVKAILLDENPQKRNEDLLEQNRLIRLDQQRLEAERVRQQAAEQLLQEQQAAEADAQRQKDLEDQRQRDLDAQRARDLAAEQVRQQQERDRAEEEAARERTEQQDRELARERERERVAEEARQQQAAANAAAAAEVARTEFEQVQAYTGIIHDLVQGNWSRPPSARNGMTVVIRIQMVPTGDILNVEIVQSSGDAAFDRAAETAINRVGRFTELQGMPINMFNANFRSLLLTFRPEDLLN
jgi:colicin import membrane protein